MNKLLFSLAIILILSLNANLVYAAGDLTVTGDLKANGFKNQSFTNILLNGDFELWTDGTSVDPDRWLNYGVPFRGPETNAVIGIYSAAFYAVSSLYCMRQEIENYQNYKGKTLTFSAWVNSLAPNKARISIVDNTGELYSDYHSGNGNWELLSVTKTIDSNATYAQVRLYPGEGIWGYFDGAMLVEGPNVVAFKDHPSDALAHGQTPINITERYAEIKGTTLIKPETGNAILSMQSEEAGYGTLEMRYKYENSKHRIGFTDNAGNWMLRSEASTNNLYLPGKLGIGTDPVTNPIELANGAYCSAAGVWTDASSRDYKENICELSTQQAFDTFSALRPVTFNYKLDQSDKYVGFIAEDVPELVASKDRKGLTPMDIIAVLTKVVQKQEARIQMLEYRLNNK